MKSFDESVDFVCRSLGMYPIKGSKFPTWVLRDRNEGFELRNNKLRPFWIIYNRRIYDQPASQKIQEIIEVFQGPRSMKEDV